MILPDFDILLAATFASGKSGNNAIRNIRFHGFQDTGARRTKNHLLFTPRSGQHQFGHLMIEL